MNRIMMVKIVAHVFIMIPLAYIGYKYGFVTGLALLVFTYGLVFLNFMDDVEKGRFK